MKGLTTFDEYTNWSDNLCDVQTEKRYVQFWTFAVLEAIVPHSEEEKKLLVSYLEKAEKNFDVVSKLLSLYLLMNSGYKPENFEKAVIPVQRNGRIEHITGVLPDALKYASSFIDSPLLTGLASLWKQIRESYTQDYEKTEKSNYSLLNVSVKREIGDRILGEYYVPGTTAAFLVTDMVLFYLFTEGKKGVLASYDPVAFADDGHTDRHFAEIQDEIVQINRYTKAVQRARARMNQAQLQITGKAYENVYKQELVEKYPEFQKDLPEFKEAGMIIELPDFYLWCEKIGNLAYYFKCLAYKQEKNLDAVMISKAFRFVDSGEVICLSNVKILNNNKLY